LEVRVEVGVGADGATAVERERRGGEGREERSLHLKRSLEVSEEFLEPVSESLLAKVPASSS
jgi:hypothetical protein